MGANICYSFIKFVNRNLDSFIWYGYYVYYEVGGKEKRYCWCHSIESVYNNADDILQKHPDAKVVRLARRKCTTSSQNLRGTSCVLHPLLTKSKLEL